MDKTVLFVLGTRPEAIKLSPIVLHLRSLEDFSVRVCVTAQHRELLDQILNLFGIVPDHDLNTMLPGQTLLQSTSRMLSALEQVLAGERPDVVVVQGDTASTLCGALAAFYSRIPVAHVEAGLRTGDMQQPFPEEMNRVLTSRLATLHFAATPGAVSNLTHEGVDPTTITITGNSGIDAVLWTAHRLEQGSISGKDWWRQLDPRRKLIVLTAHRRENFGSGLEQICRATLQLADRSDVQVVYPVHPNPEVSRTVQQFLAGHPSILLTEPLDYISFVDLMRQSYLLLTDSGGIQEEGPSLGKPVLVLREKTERPEAVEAGTARLVGTDSGRIVAEVSRLLDDSEHYQHMSRAHNPYGDGHASERTADALRRFLTRD